MEEKGKSPDLNRWWAFSPPQAKSNTTRASAQKPLPKCLTNLLKPNAPLLQGVSLDDIS